MQVVTPAPEPHLEVGGIFHGRYRIDRRIKAGGMGAVYEVTHQQTLRRCALKVMQPELVEQPTARVRFRQEAHLTAEIQSEHLVQVLDAGVDDATGLPFLVMELLAGADLRAILKARGRLGQEEVIVLLRQLAQALERTHAAGIVHRDLKPANLFITQRDDGAPWLKVLDFGIAKLVARHTDPQTTKASGTPLYMPPEQILGEGDIGPAADIYAVGMLAYKLLVGEAYWAIEYAEANGAYRFMQRVLQGAVTSPVRRAAEHGVVLPPSFARWFAVSTASDPRQRYESAHAQAEALAAVLLADEPDTAETTITAIDALADEVPALDGPADGAPANDALALDGPANDGPDNEALSGPSESGRVAASSRLKVLAGTTLGAALGAITVSLMLSAEPPPTAVSGELAASAAATPPAGGVASAADAADNVPSALPISAGAASALPATHQTTSPTPPTHPSLSSGAASAAAEPTVAQPIPVARSISTAGPQPVPLSGATAVPRQPPPTAVAPSPTPPLPQPAGAPPPAQPTGAPPTPLDDDPAALR